MSESNQPRIEPRTLKGFRDFLPEAMIPRERIIDTARRVFRSYGFAPIDTPALEYLDVLLGKGSDETDRQLYRFQDHGGRDVGLRFDLTVPLARFAAQHIGTLGTPFKRYHIAAVWRGENTQRGRYREFMQCDFDTIGTRSVVADIETALVIHDLLVAIGFSRFTMRLNNRKILTGLLEKLDLADRAVAVLRILDKLAKIGPVKVGDELIAAGASAEQAADVLALATLSGDNDHVLAQLGPMLRGSEIGEQGLAELEQVAAGAKAGGVPHERLALDVSIARGLDYYTGTVYETLLDDLVGIGSICSGGRYDNLAQLFTKQELPGVGASLGLDRLLAAMEELGMIETAHTPAEVFLAFFDEQRLHDYLALAAQLRSARINVELYCEPRRLGHQLKYADRRGFRVALIAGENEWAENRCQVKDLASGATRDASLANDAAELIAAVKEILATDRA